MIEFLIGFGILVAYFIICASTALILRKTVKINDELFRKILHFILLTSLFVFVFAFKTWWISGITCLLVIAIAYPILFACERFKTFSNTFNERKKGEIRLSLIIVFTMFLVIISICWGLLNDKILCLVAIFSWGYGDAMAALVGTKYGKHKIYRKKSAEGTLAMFITSFVVVLTILLIHNKIPFYGSIATAFIVAMASALTELYTPNGFDTITCPFASLLVLLPMLSLFGGLL